MMKTQSAFLHCTNAGEFWSIWCPLRFNLVESYPCVVPARGLLSDGDFGIANRGHAEQQRTCEPADRSSERHEGKEHQHSAIAFKAGGLEDFGPGQSGADPERGAAECAQHQSEQDKQRDFHEGVFLIEMLANLVVGRESGSEVQLIPSRNAPVRRCALPATPS